jgi:hypothetical protein
MISIETPFIDFGRVDQSVRIKSSSVDFSTLEYFLDFNDLEELSINDEFVVRAVIDTQIGESAIMRVRIIPEIIPGVYDNKTNRDSRKLVKNGMRLQYDVLSEYTTGPLTEADYYTPVELNELDLLPGQYRVECYYSIKTGWAMRSANPEVYEVTLVKDDLTVISNDIFQEVLDSKYYGVVYTFEHPDNGSWTIVFDGRLVNSIREPLPVENLSLYIEQNDRFENIANITTKKDGTFYYTHKVYGSIEQNMLVKISREEDCCYNPMNYVEYAGLEFDSIYGRYFLDNDMNLYPDWPFSIYDLLKAHSSSYTPPDSLDFWAKFEENLGNSTFDEIHSLEGTLEGNTNWTNGQSDYGLSFDGDGNIIGSTIYTMYANITYEYEGGGGVGGSEGYNDPITAQNIQVGGTDWTSPDNAKTQNDAYAIANSIAKRKKSDILRVTNFGFGIPTTATIDGIHVRVDRRASATNSIKDRAVNLVLGGAILGDDRTDLASYWPTSDQYKGYGGTTDDWGVSLYGSDINSWTFGVQIQVDNKDTSTARSAYVDHIEMIVYNTDSGSGSQVNRSIVRPNEDGIAQWNASAPVDHYSLLNEVVEEPNTPETNSGYIFTSSTFQGSYIVD